MEAVEKRKLIKQLHHIWNSGEVEAIPNVYSPNILVHWPKGFVDNKVVTRYISTGTLLGSYAGVKATGKKVELYYLFSSFFTSQ